MFALPFNFPFRKNDGSLSTIGAEISGGGGGGYELPTATASRLGGIKVGSNLSVAEDGTLSAPAPTPAYELPTASADTLGGVKIGSGISIDANGAISASGGGGGSVYNHNIKLSVGDMSTVLVATFNILNSTSTPFTTTSLNDYLANHSNINFNVCGGFAEVGSSKHDIMQMKYNNGTYYGIGENGTDTYSVDSLGSGVYFTITDDIF